MAQYRVTPQELRKLKASDYKEGDIIKVGNYTIRVKYISKNSLGHTYNTPALCSTVDKGFVPIGCTPGADRPYYIDDFLSR